MPSQTCPELLLGTSNIGDSELYTHRTPERIKSLLDCFRGLGGQRLDTASVYGLSPARQFGVTETVLRENGATEEAAGWTIDTKAATGRKDGPDHAAGRVAESCKESLANLGLKQVNVYYLHAPDRQTPLLQILQELDGLYKQGCFKQLGLSNYSAEEVEEMCELAKEHNLVKPSVYQGNYSLLCRRGDTALFPTLRKYGVAFYAYSPLAMGMCAGGKEKESLEAARTLPPGSRFHPDSRKSQAFRNIWFKDEIFAAVKLLNKLGDETGITPTELSLRWICYHSALDASLGDCIILGASSNEQLIETVRHCNQGPLAPEVADKLEEVWKTCEPAAPAYCST